MFKVGEESGDKEILIKAYKKMFLALEKGGFNSIAEAGFEIINLPIIIVMLN